MNLLFAAGLLLSLAAPTPPTGAPTPDEERLFADGLRAFDAGDARTAQTAWEQGYALRHDPAFLVRIGEAQEKNGAAREAAQTYRLYLHEAPDAADGPDIEQRLARLAAAAPAPDVTPAPTTNVVPAAPPPVLPVAPAVDEEQSRDRSARRRASTRSSGWNALNTTAWAGLAATVLLLGTAAFYGASAASHKDDVNRLVLYRVPETGAPLEYQSVAGEYDSAVQQGRHDDRVAKALLLTAAGTAAVATVFFIIDGVRESPGGVALGPGSAGGLAVAGSWRWRF
ncbi:MAG TPA: hypothetical protein VH374_17745 [Polyangia bacterium]|jgi:hypothetical protein|nr:hypothetical protein [Polyangia bacterium]